MPRSPAAVPRVVAARFVAAAARPESLPPPVGIEIAFAGRSNVGKSTLLNTLLSRKNLARTSRTPGCTRQVVLFEVRADDGSCLTLVDLPGYGYAQRSKAERARWGELIERYLLERPTLAAVVLLVDVRRGLEREEQLLLEFLAQPAKTSHRPVEILLVATKLDKLPVAARRPAIERIAQSVRRPVAGFTAQDPAMAVELWARLRRAAGLISPEPPD